MIPAKHTHLLTSAITHPGMKGKNNEDRYAVSAFSLDHPEANSVLAIVSDGIGGHRAGEVAAEMAVNIIRQVIGQSNASQPQATIYQAIIQASDAIRQHAEEDPNRKGMGATVVLAWVIGDRLYMANVGDSRLYLLRENTITKLSTDHTWIQEAIDQGVLTPEQARNHPNAHVIRRFLGSQQMVVPDLRLHLNPQDSDAQAEANQGFLLQPGDLVLLCTDGLTDLVEDHELVDAFRNQNLDQALESLVDLANDRGGHDNITIVALQVPETGLTVPSRPLETSPAATQTMVSKPMDVTQPIKLNPSPSTEKQPRRGRWLTITCLGIVILALLAAGGFGAVNFLLNRPDASATPTSTITVTPMPIPAVLPTQTGIPTPIPSAQLTPSGATPVFVIPSISPWPTNTLPPP